jgi:hypothetical protein
MDGMPLCVCLNPNIRCGNEIPIGELACIEFVVAFRRTRDPVRLNTGNAGMSALLHIIRPLSLTFDLCYDLLFLRVVPDMEQLA